MSIDRRGFLAFSTGSCLFGQVPPGPMPPPAKAKITSSVMLWTLKGSFEERVKTAALAGIQTVELVDEYANWDEARIRQAKRYVESFGMTAETVLATPNWGSRPVSMVDPDQRQNFLSDVRKSITVARQMDAPYIILMSGNEIAGRSREEQFASLLEGAKQAGALAAAADVIAIVEPLNNKVDHKGFFLNTSAEGLKLVKEVDNPHVGLLFDAYHEQVQTGSVISALRSALDYTRVVHIADAPGRSDPGTGSMNFQEIYKTLQKGGYHHSLAMEYRPKGDAIGSLKKAVDAFRAALNEREAPGDQTPAAEGSLV